MTVSEYISPVGRLILAQEEEALTGLWMEGQKYFPDLADAEWADTPLLTEVKGWLDRYFAGERPNPRSLPLAPKGSPFRQAVWQLLLEIPYGQSVTYAALAAKLAEQREILRMSAQAVGGAVGHNPISIIIPCHRVLGSDGSLTGYAGGVERKQWLLDWEKE